MGCISSVFTFGLLLMGIASVAVLIKIGGKSDGPGALLFYIGAFIGLGGAWVIWSSMRNKE